ncbi:MAG TPA: ATP-binding protein [Chloroflexota bacterium]|nr:ATP-binding protein [Chloroflexota bacterium]
MLETASSLTGARGAALIRADLVRARSLGVLRGVLADQIGAAFLELLETLAVESDAARIGSVYGRLFGLLAEEAELYPEPLVGDGWQNHLLDRLLADENAFSRKAQRADFEQIGAALLAQTRCDLVTLRALFSLDAERLARAAAHAAGAEPVEPWVSWRDFSALGTGPPLHTPAGRELKSRLAAVADWPPLAPELAAYYARVGAGLFGRYRAFRWLHNSPHGGGHLEGVPEPDPIRLEQLIGYDSERELVLQNTEQFLAGFPANSVLFYGDRGTGKSSTVKALLNAYAERGLRLVEVAKDDLADFPRIIALLRDRPERFILFIDDLSFDEHEHDYRGLKAVLEGSIEARPPNVVLYATSNRRHLVQERWSDRESVLEAEVHGQDTLQEKLSLSDRFGIRAVFPAPDQARYLAIVEALVGQRGLAVDSAELRRRALQWAEWHNGRSGRTARQFVDHLEGELALAAKREGSERGC